jgi:hypothetical protein
LAKDKRASLTTDPSSRSEGIGAKAAPVRSVDSPKPEDGPKDVAFYSTVLQAWVNSKFEKDRSIMTLSAAGVGLLVTFLTTAKGPLDKNYMIFVSCALVLFLFSILSCLIIFAKNPDRLRDILQGLEEESKLLNFLDWIANCSFAGGILFSVSAGLYVGFIR